MRIIQFDIKCAYIYGDIDKIIYMKQPLDFIDLVQPNLVCLLQRSLYRCKSGRCWNQKFVAFMIELGFMQINADSCVFIAHIKNEHTVSYILLCRRWVDNFVIRESY